MPAEGAMMADGSAAEMVGDPLAPGPGLAGVACIRHYVAVLDRSPGVYRMLDEKGGVLYVGKARNLRDRVASYMNTNGMSSRILRMVAATRSMMFLTTRTETEALLLEQNLIKQLKPRFNVLLRDDKSFPNIHITGDHVFPRLLKHRGKRDGKGDYFGPFASATAVNRTLNHLQKVFMIRNCPDSVFNNRTRPCLQYQIKRCSAPCVGYISRRDYAASINGARSFLGGRTAAVQRFLAREMNRAAENMEYERAAAFRDRIHALTQVQAVQGVNPKSVANADIIGLFTEGGQACVQVFFIRGHQNWGNHAYYPKTGAGADPDEIMEGFLGQFYTKRPPPALVLISHPAMNADLVEAMLSGKRGRKVRLLVPRRGERAMLVEGVLRNAREALTRRLFEITNQRQLLEQIAEVFALDLAPDRVEVIDNSHIQGAHPMGALIAVSSEGYLKSAYRKYTIREDDEADAGEGRTADDCAMVRQVLTRRYGRLAKEDPDRQSDAWPDLVIIDGGRGQLNAAFEALNELGLSDMPLLAISKGPNRNHGKETFHMLNRPSMTLPDDHPVLYFMQRLRDEAHRFAIGAHRSKRGKTMSASALVEIPGVGAARRSALLAHFGSFKAVRDAAIEDLQAVRGVSMTLATTIHAHLHE